MNIDLLNKFRSRTTCGETLPDGRVVDLVASTQHEQLELILWDGDQQVIVPRLEQDSAIYRAPDLDASIRRAVRFPTAANEYDSILNLLAEISELCRRNFGLPEVSCTSAAVWVASTWVPEYFQAPPTLEVAGCSLAQEAGLFRLLQAVCRRAIIVAHIHRQLPISIQPTLLLIGSGLPKKTYELWRTCSYQGVYVPGRSGKLEQMRCAKAILSKNEDQLGLGPEESLRLVLLPQARRLPELTDADLDTIAAELQPKFQLFRLRSLHSRLQRASLRCPSELAASRLAREFFALFGGEPGIRKLLQPIVEQQRNASTAQRERDPHVVIIEVLWVPAHELKPITPAEVAQRVNTLLRSRGETMVYSAREIGWKLSELGLGRHRNSKGRVLKFSRDLCRRIHEHAEQFGLRLPRMADCADCDS